MKYNSKNMMSFLIGDWSGDGHEKCINYTVLSNRTSKQVSKLTDQIKEKTGIDIFNICSEYGECGLDKGTNACLKELGFTVVDPKQVTPRDMLKIWIFLLKEVDRGADFDVLDVPSVILTTKTKRNIGYGVV